MKEAAYWGGLNWNTRLCRSLGSGARHRAIGAEHATIALLRFETLPAALTVIEELASIGRHRFDGLVLALRTGQGRFKLHPAS
jgi:hypothetical protein